MGGKATGNAERADGIDRLVHSPARLKLMLALYVVDEADFTFLMGQTKLTWGNLSANLMTLEEAGYVRIRKAFKGKRPKTWASLTAKGRKGFDAYRATMLDLLLD